MGPFFVGKASYGPFVDAKTEELRAAHDVLAECYADRLADALDHMPAERAVLGLFCDLILTAGLGASVVDAGCGTGRLEPYLAARGLSPGGIDLSPEMIRVARRDHPGFDFDVADLRELPFGDASLAGVVCCVLPDVPRACRYAGCLSANWPGSSSREVIWRDRVQSR